MLMVSCSRFSKSKEVLQCGQGLMIYRSWERAIWKDLKRSMWISGRTRSFALRLHFQLPSCYEHFTNFLKKNLLMYTDKDSIMSNRSKINFCFKFDSTLPDEVKWPILKSLGRLVPVGELLWAPLNSISRFHIRGRVENIKPMPSGKE